MREPGPELSLINIENLNTKQSPSPVCPRGRMRHHTHNAGCMWFICGHMYDENWKRVYAGTMGSISGRQIRWCPLPPAPHPAAHTVFGGREHEVPDRLVPVAPLSDEAAVPEVPFPPPRCPPIPGRHKVAGDSVMRTQAIESRPGISEKPTNNVATAIYSFSLD